MGVTLRSFIRLIHRSGMSLAFVVVLAACGGADEATPTVGVTPAAGGMVVPTATPEVATPTATVAEATVAPTFLPGDVFVAADRVLLYTDASAAAVVMAASFESWPSLSACRGRASSAVP